MRYFYNKTTLIKKELEKIDITNFPDIEQLMKVMDVISDSFSKLKDPPKYDAGINFSKNVPPHANPHIAKAMKMLIHLIPGHLQSVESLDINLALFFRKCLLEQYLKSVVIEILPEYENRKAREILVKVNMAFFSSSIFTDYTSKQVRKAQEKNLRSTAESNKEYLPELELYQYEDYEIEKAFKKFDQSLNIVKIDIPIVQSIRDSYGRIKKLEKFIPWLVINVPEADEEVEAISSSIGYLTAGYKSCHDLIKKHKMSRIHETLIKGPLRNYVVVESQLRKAVRKLQEQKEGEKKEEEKKEIDEADFLNLSSFPSPVSMVMKRENQKNTLIMHEIQERQPDLASIKELLKDYDIRKLADILMPKGIIRTSIFLEAVKYCDVAVVEYLYDSLGRPDLNLRGFFGGNPLDDLIDHNKNSALSEKSLKVAEFLIENGAHYSYSSSRVDFVISSGIEKLIKVREEKDKEKLDRIKKNLDEAMEDQNLDVTYETLDLKERSPIKDKRYAIKEAIKYVDESKKGDQTAKLQIGLIKLLGELYQSEKFKEYSLTAAAGSDSYVTMKTDAGYYYKVRRMLSFSEVTAWNVYSLAELGKEAPEYAGKFKIHVSIKREAENYTKAFDIFINILSRSGIKCFKATNIEALRIYDNSGNANGKELVIYMQQEERHPGIWIKILKEMEEEFVKNDVEHGKTSQGDLLISGSKGFSYYREPHNILDQYIDADSLRAYGFTARESANIHGGDYFFEGRKIFSNDKKEKKAETKKESDYIKPKDYSPSEKEAMKKCYGEATFPEALIYNKKHPAGSKKELRNDITRLVADVKLQDIPCFKSVIEEASTVCSVIHNTLEKKAGGDGYRVECKGLLSSVPKESQVGQIYPSLYYYFLVPLVKKAEAEKMNLETLQKLLQGDMADICDKSKLITEIVKCSLRDYAHNQIAGPDPKYIKGLQEYQVDRLVDDVRKIVKPVIDNVKPGTIPSLKEFTKADGIDVEGNYL